MAFFAKLRAQGHYAVGTRTLTGLPLSLSPTSLIKDLEKAVKRLQKAVALDPSFADAFHNLAHAWYYVAEYNVFAGQIQGFRANPQEIEDCITSALELALEAVDRAIAIRYNFPQAHNTRAGVLAKLFCLDEAMEATKVALLQDPNYKNASENREKIDELAKQRAMIPGYKNESVFLEKVKELRRNQGILWERLRKELQ